MSLIGGCFNFRNPWDAAAVLDKIRQFSPMPSICAADWPLVSHQDARGLLFAKFKPDGPSRIRSGTDAAGNALILFGFQNFADAYLSQPPGERTLPTASLLQRLEEGEGEFIAALLEPTGMVHVINDRFAAQPCYLWEREGRVIFSSNLALLQRLTGGRPVLDPLGIMQTFNYYHTLGTRTVLGGVRRLWPATHLAFDAFSLHERRYWRIRHEVEEGMDPQALAEEVWDAFKEASRLRTQGRRGMIPISGGLDSRLVAASVSPEDFSAFTRNESLSGRPTSEARLATEVARRLGFNHTLLPFPEGEFSRVAADLALLVGGMVPLNHSIKNMFSVKTSRGAGGFYMGGASGGTLAGAFVPSLDYAREPWNERLKRHFMGLVTRQTRGSLGLLFRNAVMREWYPRLEESLSDTFEGIEGPLAGHRTTIWGMIIRQPAFSFHTSAHNHPEVMDATPHLGYRYSDLMLRQPATWIYNKSFYKYMVYHNLPELRDVIYFNTHQPLPDHLHDYSANGNGAQAKAKPWRLGAWLRPLRRSMPPALMRPLRNPPFRDRTGKEDFYHQILVRDKTFHAKISEILHSHHALGELFDVARCDQFLGNMAAGRCHSHTPRMDVNLIGGLATACFFYQGLSE